MNTKTRCWGNSQTWYPAKIFTPASLEEIRQILAEAKAADVPVHVLGSSHSINDITETSGYMIRTEKLNRVLNVDKKKMCVRVEAGIKIHDLLDALMKEGLTLPNQGYIAEQAIGGAIATATHGSGRTGTLSSLVRSIELVDANGTMHVLDSQTNPHLFSAAIVHLGCLGVIYAVTIMCLPVYKMHLTKEVMNIQHVLDNLDALRGSHPFLQVVLDPYSDDALVWKYTPTNEPIHHRWLYKFKRGIIKFLTWSHFDAGYVPPSWSFPYGVKLFMRCARIKSCVDYAPLLLSPADEGHYVEMEIAVPFEHFKEALQDVRNIIARYGDMKANLVSVVVLRFVEADSQGYMSPAYQRKTAYISLIAVRRPGYDNFYKEVQATLFRYKGRPHWGKIHFLTKEQAAELYGEAYERFKDAKKTLDPDNRFSNHFSNRLFR